MDTKTVTFTENVTPELESLLNIMYEIYSIKETGTIMDKEDFNGYLFLTSVYYSYIKEVEAGNMPENTDNCNITEARKLYKKYSDKIYLEHIL